MPVKKSNLRKMPMIAMLVLLTGFMAPVYSSIPRLCQQAASGMGPRGILPWCAHMQQPRFAALIGPALLQTDDISDNFVPEGEVKHRELSAVKRWTPSYWSRYLRVCVLGKRNNEFLRFGKRGCHAKRINAFLRVHYMKHKIAQKRNNEFLRFGRDPELLPQKRVPAFLRLSYGKHRFGAQKKNNEFLRFGRRSGYYKRSPFINLSLLRNEDTFRRIQKSASHLADTGSLVGKHLNDFLINTGTYLRYGRATSGSAASNQLRDLLKAGGYLRYGRYGRAASGSSASNQLRDLLKAGGYLRYGRAMSGGLSEWIPYHRLEGSNPSRLFKRNNEFLRFGRTSGGLAEWIPYELSNEYKRNNEFLRFGRNTGFLI